MDILILIAIAAIAVLLTGLTDLRALRRPFRPKADQTETHSGVARPSGLGVPSPSGEQRANGHQTR